MATLAAFSSVSELDLKKMFARGLLSRPNAALDIAFSIWRDNRDTPKAMWAATHWPNDPDVLRFMREAEEMPLESGVLATKHQAAHEILERARKCKDDEIFCKLMAEYNKLMGFIEKPAAPAQTNTVNIVSKVIMMPSPQTETEWTRNAARVKPIEIDAELSR